MIPAELELSQLKDNDVEHKIQELSKRYFIAQRLGKPELLTQLSTLITMYKTEMSNRHHMKIKNELGGELDQLINVD